MDKNHSDGVDELSGKQGSCVRNGFNCSCLKSGIVLWQGLWDSDYKLKYQVYSVIILAGKKASACMHTCTKVVNSLGGPGIPWLVICTDEMMEWFWILT